MRDPEWLKESEKVLGVPHNPPNTLSGKETGQKGTESTKTGIGFLCFDRAVNNIGEACI